MPSRSSPAVPADALDTQVRRAVVRMVVDRSRSSNLIGIPVALLVGWVLWPHVDHGLVTAWVVLKSLVTLLRAGVTFRYDAAPPEAQEAVGRWFRAALLLDGIVFGLLGTLLLPTGDRAIAATMIATLLGIAAIGLVVLSVAVWAADALTVPVLLPSMLYQFWRGDDLSVYTGFGMGIFLFLAVVEGRRAARHTESMLRVSFTMDELAAQRQQALDQAERGNAVKSQFLATMSHEMRTPLHGLLGMARLLQRDAGRMPAAVQQQRLHVVERAGEHLLSIINDVLDRARIESGRLELQHERFELRALVDSVQELVSPAALEKGLALHVELSLGSERPVLLGDAGRLRQVLLNLLGNAVKFTPAGSVTLRVAERAQGFVFEVLDTGPGVPEADRERIFLPFEQADGSFARRHGGTGLGLTISRDLAVAMGGSLVCEAATGGGALFRLVLPLPHAPRQDADESGAALPGPVGALRGRVLLVEDNPVNALVAQATLDAFGLSVDCVGDGESAVERASGQHYDLVLMDCQMPGIDGFEATARIRRAEREAGRARTPIVALTANAFQGDRERSLAAGMDDHLAKPFRDEELAELLARHLARG